MSDTPHRVQLRRVKGWRLPPNTVVVDCRTPFGNHFGGDRKESLRAYREWVESGLEGRPSRTGHFFGGLDALNNYERRNELVRRLPELRGKDLACWCKLGEACHADILLELANREERPC
jgi:hypothetical protein